MVHPDEENLDEAPDSPPHIPFQFMNGFRSWYIVLDPNGQEVIELVSSDDEDELENPVAPVVPNNVIGNNEPNVPVGNVEPMEAFWDIEMENNGEQVLESSSESSDSEEEDVAHDHHEIGVQCNLGGLENSLLGMPGLVQESDASDSDEMEAQDITSESDSDTSDGMAPNSFGGKPLSSPPAYVCGGRGRYCTRGRGYSAMHGMKKDPFLFVIIT